MSEYDDRSVSFERRLRELEFELVDLRRTRPAAAATATVERRPAPVLVAPPSPPPRREEAVPLPPPRERASRLRSGEPARPGRGRRVALPRADFEREPGTGWAAFAVNAMLHIRGQTRLVLAAAASLLAIEAASLTVLELMPSWDWGHVAVTGLWGAIAIGLLVAGQRLAGLTWAGATVALAVLYDVTSLSGDARWASLAVAGAAALLAALPYERELTVVSGAAASTGAALAVGPALGVAGHDLQWLLVLAVGGLYAALSLLGLALASALVDAGHRRVIRAAMVDALLGS